MTTPQVSSQVSSLEFSLQLSDVLLEEDLNLTSLPVCNKSINSHAAVITEIRRRELEHWFSGLRQAELFIDEKNAALEAFVFDVRKQAREVRKLKRKMERINSELNGSSISENISENQLDRIEDCKDKIELTTRRLLRARAAVRDAMMERDAAIKERDRILSEHPEAKEIPYQQLQEICTPQMLFERQARFVAARVWAAQNNLPESVGESCFSVPPEQRKHLAQRALELVAENDLSVASAKALEILAGLPEDAQHKALLAAAQIALAQTTQGELQTGEG